MAIKLETSSLSAVWRTQDPGDAYPTTRAGPGWLSERDAQRLVACAKKRMDMAQGRVGNADYANLVIGTSIDLKGLCFVAADEFARYFSDQGYDAKPVMVRTGGSDHYFTVLNQGTAANSLIIDGTWRQFHTGGPQLRYCLIGTVTMLESALGVTQADQLLDMYKAGIKVVNRWKNYQCFPA